MSHEYAFPYATLKQVDFFFYEAIVDHEGCMVISELVDSEF